MCDFKRGRDRQGVSRSRRCPINAPSICQSAWPHQGLCHPLAIRHSSDDNPATVNAQCPYMYYPAHLNTDFSVQTAHLIQSNSEQGGKLLRPPYQTSVLLSSYSQEQWCVVQFFGHPFLVAQEHKFMLQHLLPLLNWPNTQTKVCICTIAQSTLDNTLHICSLHKMHMLHSLNSAHFACTHGWLPVELILCFVYLFINIHLGKRHSICTHYMPGRAHCLLVLVQLIHTFELHASLVTHPTTLQTFAHCIARHARPPATGATAPINWKRGSDTQAAHLEVACINAPNLLASTPCRVTSPKILFHLIQFE